MTGPYSIRPWWSRREFLKSSVAVAAGAYGLSPSFAMAAPVPEKFDGSAFKLKAPELNAKSGGVLRHGMPLRAPHFDIHQAGTIFILGAAACMFDNLIRRDPNDGAKTIIPDLAHSWEIASDGQTYTFHLRQGVQFHDGAELTSEDVKATYDRIAKPPTGISIPRRVLFNHEFESGFLQRGVSCELRESRLPRSVWRWHFGVRHHTNSCFGRRRRGTRGRQPVEIPAGWPPLDGQHWAALRLAFGRGAPPCRLKDRLHQRT